MRDAADSAAVALAEKRTDTTADRLLATLIAREAYLLGYEAARKDLRR